MIVKTSDFKNFPIDLNLSDATQSNRLGFAINMYEEYYLRLIFGDYYDTYLAGTGEPWTTLNTKIAEGLKYLIFFNFIQDLKVQATNTGMMQPKSEDMEHVTAIGYLVKVYNIGIDKLRLAGEYMDENSISYDSIPEKTNIFGI